jgi:hypothetical protein
MRHPAGHPRCQGETQKPIGVTIILSAPQLDVNAYKEGSGLAEWVPYVQAARSRSEQNIEAYLGSSGQLFYKALCSLSAGSELFVWYSDEYALYMGVPPILPSYIKGLPCQLCAYFRLPNRLFQF